MGEGKLRATHFFLLTYMCIHGRGVDLGLHASAMHAWQKLNLGLYTAAAATLHTWVRGKLRAVHTQRPHAYCCMVLCHRLTKLFKPETVINPVTTVHVMTPTVCSSSYHVGT